MDIKQLKKLANECRKAGIKHFKGPDFEFTLTDEVPVSNYKKKQRKTAKAEAAPSILEEFTSDSISQDDLLFWSSSQIQEGTTEDGHEH